MMRVILILFWFVTVSADRNNNSKHGTECYIKDPPITFGKNATLFCNVASDANMDRCNVIWQNGSETIVHCGTLMQNTTRYQHIQNRNGSFLIISSFNETDVDNEYTCLSPRKFESCNIKLKINDKDFQFIPPEESVKIETAVKSTNIVAVSIVFEKVFPRPECKLKINDEVILNCKNNSMQRPNGIFYNSTIHMECDIKPTYCTVAMSVYCAIGNTEMKYTSLNVTQKCQVKDSNANVVFSVILVPVIIWIIITVVWKTRSRCAEHQYNKNDLESQRGAIEITPLLVEQTNGNDNVILSEQSNGNDKVIASYFGKFLPVQRYKDVAKLVNFGMLDEIFKELFETNILINNARITEWRKKFTISDSVWIHKTIYVNEETDNGSKRDIMSAKNIQNTTQNGSNSRLEEVDLRMQLSKSNARINDARRRIQSYDLSSFHGPRIEQGLKNEHTAIIRTEHKCINPAKEFGCSKARHFVILSDERDRNLLKSNEKINEARKIKSVLLEELHENLQ